MRIHVAFTPTEASDARTAIVIDVLRATSTIAQALAAGYRRVLCCAEIAEARTLRATAPEAVLAGERLCVRIPGFDLGNSPREFTSAKGETVILTTTNGTRAIASAASHCDRILAGSLLNLEAVVGAALDDPSDVVLVCAGVKGEFALDDAYCAGRIADLLAGDASDAAEAAIRLSRSFSEPRAGLAGSQSGRNLVAAGLDEDIDWCARESVLDVVPRFVGSHGSAVEMAL